MRRCVALRTFLSSLAVVFGIHLSGPPPAFPEAQAQTLRGGAASLDRQNDQAEAHNFTRLANPAEVRRYVELGHLVPVVPNRDFDLHNVSFPYARPEVHLFIERLAAQYHSACGEKLVVTSLTRPHSHQPWNASPRSVHPTGMALDLRRSQRAACRNWLESTLLSLEAQGLLEAIYERNPPHYHVAVYPQPYAQYVAQVTGDDQFVAQAVGNQPRLQLTYSTHRVARGESLNRIADRYSVAVSRIRAENNLRGDRILVGQELRIPVYREITASAAPAAANGSLEHTVRSGESLWIIAQRHGLTVDDLVRANGITGSRIQPGQELRLPIDGQPAAGTTTAGGSSIQHTVRSGESLWIIAQRHGVTVDNLVRANGINGSRIQPGQELHIPLDGEIPPGTALASNAVQHTVRSGESLWIIARRHGVTVDDLTRTNAINGSRIQPGQVLEVPLDL